MEGDQLSKIQGHLALTMWMLLYEVVGCLDEDDSVLLDPLIASYLVRILFQCFKNDFESLTRLSFSLSFSIHGACTLEIFKYSVIIVKTVHILT